MSAIDRSKGAVARIEEVLQSRLSDTQRKAVEQIVAQAIVDAAVSSDPLRVGSVRRRV